MTKRLSASLFCLFFTLPLMAQTFGGGKFQKSISSRSVQPQADFGIHFPTTPVNTTSVERCYFFCFYQIGSPVESCDYTGNISLVKSLAPPFRLLNLRRAPVGSCGGTPTSLPVNLSAGEWLLHDFEFTPTQPGIFSDRLTYNSTPTGSQTEQFSWVLMGSTSGQRVRLQPQDCVSTTRSTEGSVLTSVEFKNFASEPVNIYWIDYNGNRNLFRNLASGQSYIQIAYITHVWLVIGQSTGTCYGIFTAIGPPGLAEIGDAIIPCTPPQVAPQVSSPNTSVRVGDPATVNWTTTETVDRFALEVRSVTGLSRTFHVPGSLRSVTFAFPEAGVFEFKVVAENACGRKEGTPAITFHVAPAPARLVLTTPPPSMMGITGGPAASDSFSLTNLGGSPTNVQLQRSGSGTFFNHQPAEFTLAPGLSRIVTVTATTQATGQHEGEIVATASGGAGEIRIPVRLLVDTRPSGTPDPQPDRNRVDLSGTASESPTGSVRFQNRGNGSVKGILLSDPWIILEQKFVILSAGQSATVNFRIDRALRSRLFGSEAGRIILVYLEGTPAKSLRMILGATPPPGSKSTLVTVTDTVKPEVSTGAIPAIADGEVAYFLSGVGSHARLFNGVASKSDVAVLNASLAEESNLRLFYTETSLSGDQSHSTSFSDFSANQTLSMNDVVKSLFSQPADGVLQIRASSGSLLSIDARTFFDLPGGSVGARIPVFRSDRGAARGEKLYLTGLRSDSNFVTDVFLQETAGESSGVSLEFLDSNGNPLTNPLPGGVQLQKFGTITDFTWVAPAGTATVVVNNSTAVGGGKVQAYARVIDQRSGDSWVVADWGRVNGFTQNEPVAIPVVGKLNGRNGTSYRSDVTLMNTGTATASGNLTFFPAVGPPQSVVLQVAAEESRTLSDVLASQFGLSGGIGYLIFSPSAGSFVVTSRTYTTTSSGATASAGVPVIPLSSALKPGEVRKFSNIEDAASVTVTGAKPGTFRTNFGLLETLGKPATVRVTLRYTAVQGSASTVGVSSADFALAPGQFLMWSSITTAVMQSRRGDFGDLRDLQAEFEVIDGTGNVAVFVTSTENGTNDTEVRLD